MYENLIKYVQNMLGKDKKNAGLLKYIINNIKQAEPLLDNQATKSNFVLEPFSYKNDQHIVNLTNLTFRNTVGKIMVSLSDVTVKALEKEKKKRLLETVHETIRIILSDHFRKK